MHALNERLHSLHVGDLVNYHARIDGPITSSNHRVRAIAVVRGRVVVWLEGKTGFVAFEALSATFNDN